VVRKGATAAFPGQLGFVGGSMGDDAVIIEGIDSEESRAALYSTVHGAGRLFGRKEAKQRFPGAEMDAWLRDREVC
jgi:tRNA-splicing ligase RtcB (3'-phosphate/5'-hydroxy nucleic acid ligase)